MAANTLVTSAMILPLSSTEATLARAGGKGANLAELTRARFDVPPGFIVTTDAYRAFVSVNQIEARLLALAGSAPVDDPTALESISAEIRALFTSGHLPPEMAASIQAAYAALLGADSTPVAVRSSATAEDLPGMSFAGQQDTYLNIVGSEALIEAVKSCWGSLWTARAMGYRAHNHIPPNDVALAVVVQALIPSEVSGVLFTANPLTGHRGETVIDASFGLGEAIVSGQVEPDHYVVNHQDMRIIARKLGAKALSILPRSAGGTESVSADHHEQQALPDAQILDLARTANRVAEHFGTPQDIEWAWAAGRMYLLQSRPITSLYPVPESLLASKTLRIFFSFNSVQGVVEPLTPLCQDLFPVILTGLLRSVGVRRDIRKAIVTAGDRLYIDITDMANDHRMGRGIAAVLSVGDPGARQSLQTLVDSGRIRPGDTVKRGQLLRLIAGFRPVIFGALVNVLRPEAAPKPALRRTDRFVAEVRQAFDGAGSLPARLAVIDRYGPDTLRKIFADGIAPAMVPGLLAQAFIDRWLVAWLGLEPGTMRRLMRGLPNNPTIDMDLKLWAVAQAIRSDPASLVAFRDQTIEAVAAAYQAGTLPTVAQTAIRGFLDEYGMRAVREIDLGMPRWREDPRSILQTLSSFLTMDDPNQAPDRLFLEGRAESERLAAEYVTQVRQRKGRLRAWLLGAAIRRMRLLTGLREMPKFYMIKLFDLFRTAFLESGRELVSQGKLERADDIFFVPLDRLRAIAAGEAVDLKAIVERRRADYDRELARRQMPRLLLSTGEVFYQGMSDDGTDALIGDGVSPGLVEGTVRVVLDPRGVRLEPGEILVCPATDPGWTPLFLSAGGLVMELGGMITHGSVVAREYGIPAVVGVHEATTRLKTGQRVRVDGSAGRVVVLDAGQNN